jgi:hypothetical protein
VFVLYSLTNQSLDRAAELAGFLTGFSCGVVLLKGSSERKPPLAWVGAVFAAAVVVATAGAVPLRGLTDVRPEIGRVVAFEDRTAQAYQTEVDRFKKGRITAKTLVQLIDQTIMPELRAVRSRVKALSGVPREHQPVVAEAEEYLRLRAESWRLRAQALQRADMIALREADKTEKASLEAFERIRPADQP